VHVLTRANNVRAIENELAKVSGLKLAIHGYDLPKWARWWKKGSRGMRLYYVLWQRGAYRYAQKLHARQRFDLVHHITFGVFRHPSFMGRLGIPFIFGPIGGGEYAPQSLLRSLPLRGRIAERMRNAANRAASFDPLVQGAFRRATLICCNTAETMERVPAHYRGKTICVHDVASDAAAIASNPSPGAGPRFLFVGRLLYWKGVHLALRALAELRREVPDAEFTIVGDGRDRAWLEALVQQLNLGKAVQWRGWLPRAEVQQLYAAHCAFLFPSLHDSGGTVVLEAMSQGLPVICLDLGGPGSILPAGCGAKITARGRSEEQVIADLTEAMKKLATHSGWRDELAANALKAARAMTWTIHVRHAYEEIEKALARNAGEPVFSR
jgi:glycosyltransferase involved in cell wall biosynthesis